MQAIVRVSTLCGLNLLLNNNLSLGFPVVLVVKNLPASAVDIRDTASIPGSGRALGGGHGNHSSILAWRIPWTEEPGGLKSMGGKELDTTDTTAHVHNISPWAVL